MQNPAGPDSVQLLLLWSSQYQDTGISPDTVCRPCDEELMSHNKRICGAEAGVNVLELASIRCQPYLRQLIAQSLACHESRLKLGSGEEVKEEVGTISSDTKYLESYLKKEEVPECAVLAYSDQLGHRATKPSRKRDSTRSCQLCNEYHNIACCSLV